jgi:hypothetical protein
MNKTLNADAMAMAYGKKSRSLLVPILIRSVGNILWRFRVKMKGDDYGLFFEPNAEYLVSKWENPVRCL